MKILDEFGLQVLTFFRCVERDQFRCDVVELATITRRTVVFHRLLDGERVFEIDLGVKNVLCFVDDTLVCWRRRCTEVQRHGLLGRVERETD